MECRHCKSTLIVKNGKQNNMQRYKCNSCKKVYQLRYRYNACKPNTSENIKQLVKEGMGIRNISRYLSISTNTTLRKIKWIASQITKSKTCKSNQFYQVDEMRTFVRNKEEVIWIFYALNKKTKEVIDFVVGRRTSKNAKKLIEQILEFRPKRINTDKLNIYPSLIPKQIHKTNKTGTNHIERKNLTLRTNLKRLQRKSICYSRSKEMLISSLTIFFWG